MALTVPLVSGADPSAPRPVSIDLGTEELECVIEPHALIELGSAVEGVIESIAVERSDLVEAGQVLAQLESSVEKAAVAVARARAGMQGEVLSKQAGLEFGERRKARAAELYKQKALSYHERDESATDAKRAKAELRKAKENKRLAQLELRRANEALERRTLRSPIAGVVVDRLMSPGELVTDEPVLKLAQIDPLRVEAIASARLFGAIKPGMRAEVTPEAPGVGVYQATVSVVDRVIDPASGTFRVRAELPNPNYKIPGGLRCRVRFIPQRPAARAR